MPESFSLRNRFELEGVFWNANTPDQRFAGTLISDGKKLELVTCAELVEPEVRLLPFSNVPAQVLGHIDGEITYRP